MTTVTNGLSITGYWKVGTGHLDTWPDCSNLYFTGSIDDIRIFKRTLTDDEVEVLYQEQLIEITLENEAICEASGSTNLIIENSETGVSYQLINNETATPIGSPIEGTAGTIYLPTGTLNANTSIKIIAENTSTSCINEFDSVYSIAVGNEIIPEVHITSNAAFEEFCKGDTAHFTKNSLYGGGAPVYSWMINGSEIGNNEESFSVSNLDNQDVVSLKLTSSVECANPKTVTSNEITVTINPLPMVDLGTDQSINADESLTLDAGAGFTSYLWNTDEITQQISVDGSQGVGEYEYFVQVTDNKNCSNSDTVIVEIKSVLSSKFTDKDIVFKAWPNPVKDFLYFEFTNDSPGNLILEIINQSGQKLFSKSYSAENKAIKDQIYMGGYYKSEIYFMVIKNTTIGKKVIKIVVEK
ncbi:MAG: hypothetical protein HC831_11025 [Chloroflexia bacterium]|nr:hypothetical protein [Chloroflexia bacterium]